MVISFGSLHDTYSLSGLFNLDTMVVVGHWHNESGYGVLRRGTFRMQQKE